MSKTVKASECKCIKCGKQAARTWKRFPRRTKPSSPQKKTYRN